MFSKWCSSPVSRNREKGHRTHRNENAGYLAEAAAVYRELRTEVPEDGRFGSQLIWLYWNAGLIMASNEEIAAAK